MKKMEIIKILMTLKMIVMIILRAVSVYNKV
jgi:hypothetical protein